MLLGTATPIQTDVAGPVGPAEDPRKRRTTSSGTPGAAGRMASRAVPVITGVASHGRARGLVAVPQSDPAAAKTRSFSGSSGTRSAAEPDSSPTGRSARYRIQISSGHSSRTTSLTPKSDLGFFQRNNPVVRHVVLRKRATLETLGLASAHPGRHPSDAGPTLPGMFDGLASADSAAFDVAYEAADKFTRRSSKRKKSAGL